MVEGEETYVLVVRVNGDASAEWWRGVRWPAGVRVVRGWPRELPASDAATIVKAISLPARRPA